MADLVYVWRIKDRTLTGEVEEFLKRVSFQ